MQKHDTPAVLDGPAQHLFLIATRQGGLDANVSGKAYQAEVFQALQDFGLCPWDAKTFADVDGRDGAALMRAAYEADRLLGHQSMFKGIVVPQLVTKGIYSLNGTEGDSRRDIAAVIEHGRVRAGVSSPLTFHIELKYQDSTGSTDEKAKGLAQDLLAGGADYCMVLYGGIGAVPGAHDHLDRCAMLSDSHLRLVNEHEVRAGVAPRTGKFFYANSLMEHMNQLAYIIMCEADGKVANYADWRKLFPYTNPSDTRTASQQKKARRDEKEAAQRGLQSAMVSMSNAARQLGFGFTH